MPILDKFKSITNKFKRSEPTLEILSGLTDIGRVNASKILIDPLYLGYESKIEGKVENLSFHFVTQSRFSKDTYYQVFEFPNAPDTDNVKDLFKVPVKISCSCHDYKFRLIYVSEKNKYLSKLDLDLQEIGKALTDAPDITNPKQDMYLCKHLYRCQQKLESMGMKVLMDKQFKR